MDATGKSFSELSCSISAKTKPIESLLFPWSYCSALHLPAFLHPKPAGSPCPTPEQFSSLHNILALSFQMQRVVKLYEGSSIAFYPSPNGTLFPMKRCGAGPDLQPPLQKPALISHSRWGIYCLGRILAVWGLCLPILGSRRSKEIVSHLHWLVKAA